MSSKDAKPATFDKRVNIISWMMRHLQVMLSSLGRLWRNPLSTFMTVAVMGIAISLPTGLHTLVENVQELSGSWEGASSISVFLKKEISDQQSRKLANELKAQANVAQLRYISPAMAMEEFRQLSEFGEALDLLDENPLPAVLLIYPAAGYDTPEKTSAFAKELETRAEVETAQIDLQWLRRLHGITSIIERGVIVLGAMLAVAVLLIVGNTIRLEIQNRRAEIEITKLVGATNAFIRRPFLYDGFCYGFLGGIIAWLLVSVSLLLLQGPVEHLAGLYQSRYQLANLSLGTFLAILLVSLLLGLLGAWIAVNRHLDQIRPT
jgi:cell division transport system permease protein